jgi:putative nucleotidyltransferase with HDIG domain
MGNGKPSSFRRREMRRTLRRDQAPWLHPLRDKAVMWSLLYVLGTALLTGLVMMAGEGRSRYGLGQMVTQAVVPRVEFRAVDEFSTRREQEDARDREPAVYKINMPFLTQIREQMRNLLQMGIEYDNLQQIPGDTRQNLAVDEAALRQLKSFAAGEEAAKEWEERVTRFVDGVASIALLREERKKAEVDPAERAPGITIVHPRLGELPRQDSFIYGMGDLTPFRQKVTSFAEDALPPAIRRSAIAVVMQNPQPMYFMDKEETANRRKAAMERQQPVEMLYKPSDVLIQAGTHVGEFELRLLNAEHEAYQHSLMQKRVAGVPGWLVVAVGRLGVVLIIAACVWGYILAYNPRIAENPMRGMALTVLFVLCQGMAVFFTGFWPEYVYAGAIFPTLLTAIVLAIAYDQRFALALGALHTLLVVVTLNESIGFAIVLLVGVGVAVAQLREVRTRSKLVSVGFWTGIAMAFTTVLAALAHPPMSLAVTLDTVVRDAMAALFIRDALAALFIGIATGIFVQGILPGIERLFRVTTSMTLKELNDASHPLLRRLAQEAAGTYQHSLRIADMAEAAADAIGADTLLCRVGAMYHDIGKMNKPQYFVENQGGGPNRHAKLSPAMSLLIIVGHVKDGIQMAREYHLPPALRQFIETHHGTTLVEFFYHAARQQKAAENAPAPAEFEFRYPGPKPQTREAAILMLCDGVEGAARTLPEPTAIRIEQLVHAMAMKRLMDGQFDECNLTLAELHKIEQAIMKMLTAIYHGRIAYPKSANEPPRPRLAGAAPTPTSAAS